MSLRIGTQMIGPKFRPFIIAEMSGNHNQSLERALAIVDAAADAGAQAIKLQTYTSDTITMESVYRIDDPQSLWNGKELYQLYQEAYTPWEWHAAIFARAHQRGLIAFSSPFDESAVDFLETLDVPAYKIASFENTHHPLLRKVAATNKPVIMSTGVASLAEISESIEVLKSAGCSQLILLKCTSTYPASPENSNLLTIPDLRSRFQTEVGLSDHTMGIGVPLAAIALGAVVIEKHFTLSRAEGGVDAAFSIEPQELKSLVDESERAWLGLGTVTYELSAGENKSREFKRSIYVSSDIRKGEPFTPNNVRVIRPAKGLLPKYYTHILGMIASRDMSKGHPLQEDDIQGFALNYDSEY